MKTLNRLYWSGASFFIFVLVLASVFAFYLGGLSSTIDSTDVEVVHDTITVEVIKEVQVPCSLPHVQVRQSTKPVEIVEKVEPKDTVQ